MRVLLFSLLTNSEDFTAIFGDRIYPQGSLGKGDVPSNPEKPYVMYAEQFSTVHHEVEETSNATTHNFNVYFYDEIGSMTRINRGIDILRNIIKGVNPPVQSPSGKWLMRTRWNGASNDYTDERTDSVVRFALVGLTSAS